MRVPLFCAVNMGIAPGLHPKNRPAGLAEKHATPLEGVPKVASLKKRGTSYYAQYYVGNKQRRISLQTESYQVARENIRKLESSLVQQSRRNPYLRRTRHESSHNRCREDRLTATGHRATSRWNNAWRIYKKRASPIFNGLARE
jgi:hypothetical protein